ncbi:MAG: hypothetical protein J5I81_08370 [Nitrococcus mobilis]|nr:hypothetical protein [Nitrococcus mobilis]
MEPVAHDLGRVLQHPHFTKAIRLLDTVACTLHTLDALHLAIALSEGIELVTADRLPERCGRGDRASLHASDVAQHLDSDRAETPSPRDRFHYQQ